MAEQQGRNVEERSVSETTQKQPRPAVSPVNGAVLDVKYQFGQPGGNQRAPGGIAGASGISPGRWLAALADCTRDELRAIAVDFTNSASKISAARTLLDAIDADESPESSERRGRALDRISDRIDGKAKQGDLEIKVTAQDQAAAQRLADSLTPEQLADLQRANDIANGLTSGGEP